MSVTDESGVGVPRDVLVNRRWVKIGNVEWAQEANGILLEHGVVFGTGVYDTRHEARWRARKLIGLMVDLGMHERWQLVEHVNRRGDGWAWSVEYRGKNE